MFIFYYFEKIVNFLKCSYSFKVKITGMVELFHRKIFILTHRLYDSFHRIIMRDIIFVYNIKIEIPFRNSFNIKKYYKSMMRVR